MKNMKKLVAIMLALSFIISMFSFNVFANDDSFESPIIPIGPVPPEWYEYTLDDEMNTAILSGFDRAPNRTKVIVRATYEKNDKVYSVIGVDKDVFKGSDIQSVVIEEGVQFIDEGAFANCEKLATVTVAASVTSIDPTAFDGSKWLNDQPDGLVYAGKIAYKVKGACPASVTLKADTVAIAEGAFAGQTTLEKIIIPRNTTVGAGAFSGCTAVTFYCYENSPAAEYAAANEINVVVIPKLFFATEPSKKEYYQNDEINLNGAELIYISEDGETPVDLENVEVTGFDSETLGAKTVTITYMETSVSFDITVVERPAFILGDVDGNDDVNLDDAIHLLYYLNFPQKYSVNQPIDFNHDGLENLDDAIYVLYHINFPQKYPLY